MTVSVLSVEICPQGFSSGGCGHECTQVDPLQESHDTREKGYLGSTEDLGHTNSQCRDLAIL